MLSNTLVATIIVYGPYFIKEIKQKGLTFDACPDGKCVPEVSECTGGQFWHPYVLQCMSVCTGGMIGDTVEGICVCPHDRPIWKDNECVAEEAESAGLSGGAIAGIVKGVGVLVGIIVFVNR